MTGDASLSIPRASEKAAPPSKEIAAPANRRKSLLVGLDEVEHPTEEWMLSYSDMVTLLLTMFIALLLNADFTRTSHGGNQDGAGTSAIHGGAAPGAGDARSGLGASRSGARGNGGDGAGSGMKGALEDWFHLAVTSPYKDDKAYALALHNPVGPQALPEDADLAVIKDRDLAQIVFREQALASIRQKLVAAGIDQYVSAEVEGDGIRLNIPNAILFALGSADFASTGAGVIRAIVPIVANDTYTISVEGHTDNAPIRTERFPSNWELSAQRAASVVRVMVEAGIAPKRLEAVGLADTQPLAADDSPEARAQNRRVTIFLRL
jgi:chemotaxis protein MotB